MIDIDISGKRGGFSYRVAFRSSKRVTGIFGRSGAGKSTILEAVSGALKPEKGHININGVCYCDHLKGHNLSQQKRRVGYVFQDARLFPHISVQSNLTFSRWAGRRSSGDIAFDDVVALLGLEDFLERKPDSLSGGEKQRVSIGRALLSNPHILLMDEPLSGLDYQRKSEIMPYLEAMIKNYDLPVLFISHDLNEIAHLCSHLVLLEKGRVQKSDDIGIVFPLIEGRFAGNYQLPSVLIKASFQKQDAVYSITWLKVGTQKIVVPDLLPESEEDHTLRIEADNVALCLSKPEGLTIQNVLKVEVMDFRRAGDSSVDIVLNLEGQCLMARITRKAFEDLDLKKGQDVYSLIKSVAVAVL